MPILRLVKLVERHTEYELEVLVQHPKDVHRVGAVIPKPLTMAKVQAALLEVLNNSPDTGSPLISSRWEGFEVVL